MKNHIYFIVGIVAIFWVAMFFGMVAQFWVKALGALIGFFGFLFVFMLTDAIGDGIRTFGIDLIFIAIGLLVIWV